MLGDEPPEEPEEEDEEEPDEPEEPEEPALDEVEEELEEEEAAGADVDFVEGSGVNGLCGVPECWCELLVVSETASLATGAWLMTTPVALVAPEDAPVTGEVWLVEELPPRMA